MTTDPMQDPRVRQIDDYLFAVEGRDDKYFVEAQQPGVWLAHPQIGSPSMRRANLRTREEAEEWSQLTTTRHPSVREALTYALTRVGEAR